MNPLFAIIAIAGAFWLGRSSSDKEKKKAIGPIPSPIPLPLPSADDIDDIDVPDLDIPGQDAAGVDNAQRTYNAAGWDRTNFEILVYPRGADKLQIYPPSTASGISAARDCSVVAVGRRWWDRAGQVAKQLHEQGQLSVGNLERALFPNACRGSQGRGIRALRIELLERAGAQYGSIRNAQRAPVSRRRNGARWWIG